MASNPDRDVILAALERRLCQARLDTPGALYTDFDGDHPSRQEFRRMIEPGIVRPNPSEVALEALKTMKRLAENILKHPNEAKYHRFKPTNEKIQRLLINPSGVIEYVRKMGFNPEVDQDEWQPYYVFSKKHMSDLRIGLSMINEALERELPKKEREETALKEAKAAEEAAKDKAKKRFMDDRMSVRARAARERHAPAPTSTPSKKTAVRANIRTLADLESHPAGHEASGSAEPASD